ncbi:hypothetical protein [Nitrospirillum sp. BR 11828]|uniref:hypothetical protein n=1 Tax=Nitrospirillum sp. BR 11828 TaxID=3104325 RepID=UPI002ACAE11A|nr:hypothetical protein [Nitrospirillum sp. BR 11828]MDZ5645968.1 hypothetical protein [Nitrospirillum sp. BR 11828]
MEGVNLYQINSQGMILHRHVAWLMILIPFLLGLVLYGRYGRHALWGIAAIALLVPGGIVLLFGGGRSTQFVPEVMLPLALVFGLPSTLLALAIAALFKRLWRRPPAP